MGSETHGGIAQKIRVVVDVSPRPKRRGFSPQLVACDSSCASLEASTHDQVHQGTSPVARLELLLHLLPVGCFGGRGLHDCESHQLPYHWKVIISYAKS